MTAETDGHPTASVDWVAVRTLRNILQRHLAESAEDPDASARPEWDAVVVASTNTLASLLRLDPLPSESLSQRATLVARTASTLLSSHEDTLKSLRPAKGQDLMASLLKTISGAAGMPLTLWTSGGAISGQTTSLSDFFTCAVDHLENKVSAAHHGILRQQSAKLSNTVLPDVILLATEQGQKVAVRIEDISAWTLG